jgi:hypothetical protein
VQNGGRAVAEQAEGSVRAGSQWIAVLPKRALGSIEARKEPQDRCHGDDQIHANPQSGGRWSHEVTCPGACPKSVTISWAQGSIPHVAGAVSIDRRAQALLPTVMAQSIANDFRHHSEETSGRSLGRATIVYNKHRK